MLDCFSLFLSNLEDCFFSMVLSLLDPRLLSKVDDLCYCDKGSTLPVYCPGRFLEPPLTALTLGDAPAPSSAPSAADEPAPTAALELYPLGPPGLLAAPTKFLLTFLCLSLSSRSLFFCAFSFFSCLRTERADLSQWKMVGQGRYSNWFSIHFELVKILSIPMTILGF